MPRPVEDRSDVGGAAQFTISDLSRFLSQVHPSIMRTIRAAVHRLPGFQDIDTGNAIR